jgi:nucleotide-binding universal stress UspA family protein
LFEKILLPLDGSELAESAIPYTRDLAAHLGAEVFLLHVCPPEHQVYLHMHQIYLNTLVEGLRESVKQAHTDHPLNIQAEAITGDPAKIILDYVKLKNINLVVMTSFGASGLRSWAMGSVADKIVRGVGIPCLLIRMKKEFQPEKRGEIRKILVPLDSSDASKVSIPYAVELAKKLKASITLFAMAQTVYAQHMDSVGAGIGVNWDSIDANTEKYTDQDLHRTEEEISAAGIEVNHVSYLGIDAGYEILEMEKRIQADLVVMATRGRSPIARWAFGSVAEKVLREGERPIMLIRQKEEK